jgi:hypothetical protein
MLPATLFLAAGISACSTIRTGAHYDQTVDFSGYQSYSWISANPLILGDGERSQISPLTQSYIIRAIAVEVESKGFVFAGSPDEADFIVSYTVGTREKIDSRSYPVSYQGYWGWHLYGRYYYTNEVHHRSYTEGTLSIDIFDGKSKQPIWHGWASKTITDADRKEPSPIINKAVAQIFEQFPPG